ncbi:hypothetical protein JB92DRAFT_3253786 [Gautieria morchelliformis]|nr:hypothetical protein JB92DRAFT_3253786 [Gautieria morchelliformis]
MYRGTSPIFDVPEFPPLRRVKPLPKRRRTSGEGVAPADTVGFTPVLPADGPVDMTAFGLNLPLPPYYMPMFSGVQEMFRMSEQHEAALGYPGRFAEEHGDGDYVDHLQQPGNTKKRKVPAAHHGAGDAPASPITALEGEELDEHGQLVPVAAGGGGDGVEAGNVLPAAAAAGAAVPLRKNRSSAATLAGLQHKELLKTRKRQLAAVLGALSHGDTLALDQALSARYSSMVAPPRRGETYERPLRRWGQRRTTGLTLLPAPAGDGPQVPSTEFTFACPSPTSERLVSTREEVAVLHARFEAELARQAAKAAEVAKQGAQTAEGGTVAKRGPREQRARSAGTPPAPSANTGQGDAAGGGGAKTRTAKKKKRSALANASNPHHLRNYVPSRMPHTGPATGVQAAGAGNASLVSPAPVRFLAAEIAPRRGKKTTGAAAAATATGPAEEEWICALCEYNLFYGADAAFRRAVRSRKKILVRRRRARERAAAAARGQKTGAARAEPGGGDVDGDAEGAGGDGDGGGAGAQAGGALKRERDKHGGV